METYKNFDVAVFYSKRYNGVAKNEICEKWILTKHIKINHVYIETYRGRYQKR